ncbi:AfsR/SARP family transcriptional regulator [Micromonospora sp. NPDC051006]|uniref:AfsR/SARP family transcriptional regulator n=1 Tax=Micromonospora sp. NPDC051006 TaxID=3364283 RepID=UPI0037BD9D55
MRISLLGPLEVHTDSGAPVEVGGARLRRLLIVLALEPGRLVSAGRLVDAIWDGQPPAGAVNALQALVSRLRRAAPGLPVEAGPGGYRLAVEPTAVDVHRFEAALTAGRALLATDPSDAARRLDAGLTLWRGPALADAADADFARAPVARLDELRLAGTEDLIEARAATEDPAALLPRLRELVTTHPLRERLAHQLILTLHRAGRPAEALTEYDRLRTTLAETLGADPGPELNALHLAVLRGEPAAGTQHPRYAEAAPDLGAPTMPGAGPVNGTPGPAQAAPTAPADRHPGAAAPLRAERAAPTDEHPAAARFPVHPPGGLPATLTSFVGREAAVDRVGDLLGRSRLVTLTGPGGAGKTRLAIESGRAVAHRFPDGVWLVELAPVTDPAEVPQAVLALLGLREQALIAGRPRVPPGEAVDPTARLIEALAPRCALLVLDNCEHLLDAAAELADRLLGAAPDLRVLATSREPLGITGETLRPVEPLALPPPGADPAAAAAYPSVRLFIDRAGAVRPDFGVDTGTVAAVVGICRALDGIPLAIELAAARLRSMTADQVAARLDDRFRLLTGGSRTALPRHQTLRAVIDWSWDLLDPAERALWRRLAVFTGGATAATVERVCAGGELPPDDVFDRLSALVEKSLVLAVGDREPRYRMLETIREYGLARLAEAGEGQRMRQAHAAEFLALAERADPELRGPEQLRWIARLRADHDNLHAALRWVIGAGDAGTAVRLVGALGWYWWLRGQRAEGADLTREVVALAERTAAPLPPEALATAYAVGGMNLLAGHADLDGTRAWMRRAAELADDTSEHIMLRLVGPMSGMVDLADPRAALPALRKLFTDPEPWVAAVARLMHGHMVLNGGSPAEEAAGNFRAALELFETAGDRWGISTSRFSLADLATRSGDHATAIAHLREALRDVELLGAAEDVPQMRAQLAHLWWQAGDRDQARALLDEAYREAERLGADEPRAAVAFAYSDLLRDAGDWPAAARWAERAAAVVGRRNVAPQWRAMVTTALGHVTAAVDDLPAARAHLDRALALAIESTDAPVVSIVLVGYADLALRAGRPAEAATLLGGADGVRGGSDRGSLDAARVTRAAHEALGEPEFAEAYAGGRGTRPDQACELIRVTLDA